MSRNKIIDLYLMLLNYYVNFIDIFADISYGYCITNHKSQGSPIKYLLILKYISL